MSRVFAALPRAVAFVAIGAALLLGFLWVNEPLLDQPEPGLFGRKHIEEDVVHLVDPGIVSEGQWQMGETSARLALILSAILIVSVLATWRKRETRDPQLRSVGHGARMRRVKLSMVMFVLLLIGGSAAYPAYLIRRGLEAAANEGVPREAEPPADFDKPTPLTPIEREAMGWEISPDHPDCVLLLTRAGVFPHQILNCPVHDKPLVHEHIPHHPELPGHNVREGFPFGQLAFAQRVGVRFPHWSARRCPDCVTLHERYLGISEEELRFKAERLPWGFDF